MVDHTLRSAIGENNTLVLPPQITGFDGAAETLISVGRYLRPQGKLLFIFFDQFENLFFLQEAFKRIRDIFLKVSNAESNIIFGFCWKTDLVGLTNEFPYQLRDSIRASSKVISLEKFLEAETSELLDKLSVEIGAPLRKDLRFFLSEFSQGYPWLLKKLCAHVKAQREAKIAQIDIANGLLNVQQLFQEDLKGLTAEEEDALRRIAKLAPIDVADLSEELRPPVIQTLIDRRLLVRIGTKLDVYWDIFRDFLNTGRVPAQEQYIPRLGTRSVYRACKILADAKGTLSAEQLARKARLSSQSFYNVAHEFRMLGLAKISDDRVTLVPAAPDYTDFQAAFRFHVGEKLKRNRLVLLVLEQLTSKKQMSIAEVADVLKRGCPYISASSNTWEDYADMFCDWLDAGDLAIHDRRAKKLLRYQPGTELRERYFARLHRRGGPSVLPVHYSPVETVALALSRFLVDRRMTWPIMGRTTTQKALFVLEDFGYVTRTPTSTIVHEPLRAFVNAGFDVSGALGTAALKIESFREFINILETNKQKKLSHLDLGRQLKKMLHADWSDGTARTTVKVAMDWARHTKLAPGVYALPSSRKKKTKDSLSEPTLL